MGAIENGLFHVTQAFYYSFAMFTAGRLLFDLA